MKRNGPRFGEGVNPIDGVAGELAQLEQDAIKEGYRHPAVEASSQVNKSRKTKLNESGNGFLVGVSVLLGAGAFALGYSLDVPAFEAVGVLAGAVGIGTAVFSNRS